MHFAPAPSAVVVVVVIVVVVVVVVVGGTMGSVLSTNILTWKWLAPSTQPTSHNSSLSPKTLLHCNALYRILKWCAALHCTTLYVQISILQYCTVLYCTVLYCTMDPPAILGLRGVGEGVAAFLALDGTEGEAGGCGDALLKKLIIALYASRYTVSVLERDKGYTVTH